MKILKEKNFLILYTLIVSFFQIYGYLITNDKSLKDFNFKYLLYFLLLFIILFIYNNLIFKLLSLKIKNDSNPPNFSKRRFLIIWITIFILWIPILLAYYPTIFAYDTDMQIPHLANRTFESTQPLFHTLIIEFWIILGKKISSIELGLLLLSLFQMLIMSGIFAFSIEKINTKIYNKKFNILFITLMIIYYGLIPFNSIMSFSITKDVLFSGLTLLLILNLYDLIEQKNPTKITKISFIFFSVLFMLIKNNSINILCILTILLIIFVKQKQKLFIKLFSISIMCYYILLLIIIIIFKPVRESNWFKNSIIIQNTYYISLKHPKILNDDFFQKNKCILEKDTEIKAFNKHNVDNIIYRFKYCDININETKKEWNKYIFKYPIDYIDSYSNITVGLWYLNDTSHTYEVYDDWAKVYLQTQQQYVKQYESKLPKLKEKYELIASGDFQYKNYKFLRYLFAPASYILLFFLLITYLLQNKRKKEIIPLLLLIIITGCILIGPCILIRYVYPFMATIPILFFRILINNKEEVE